eukprot:TRINITY_DN2268_c0_g1_i3.p1 TRINITY_DN2268_c0_g1~~TRINITY_DN2268_c0_g1_i3.p1  ORF type:complete len:248 (-),score=40.32 TRINITY_DN2268_c0_g1_i3:104-847(-)
MKSLSPTTILDLNTFTVKQTPPYNEYGVVRKDYQDGHCKVLAKMSHSRTPANADDTVELYRQVLPSDLIHDIVNRLFSLPASPSYLRAGFLQQSIDSLIKKSIILIKYIDAMKEEYRKRAEEQANIQHHSSNPTSPAAALRKEENAKSDARQKTAGEKKERRDSDESEIYSTASIGPSSLSPSPSVYFESNDFQTFKRSVMRGLGISEVDFGLLLGVAEKIKPGSYVDMTGNPAWIEEKLIELFEQF